MSKGGYDGSFPGQYEAALPVGLDLTPGTWHQTAAFCDWRSLAAASCCCSWLQLPVDFKPLRHCVALCKGPAEYPEVQRRRNLDDGSDGSDDSEDDTSLFLQPIHSVNFPFVRLQSNGLLEIADTIQSDTTEQVRTVLDQRSLSEESLELVATLQAFVDTIRLASPLTHLDKGSSSFLEFRNVRSLTVHDAKWLRPIVLYNTKLYNLECLTLSFLSSWDKGENDEELASYLQKYHQDHLTSVGTFSFDEAWSHGLVDSLPALHSLRVECKQLKTREQRARRDTPLTSLLIAASRRSLRSLSVHTLQRRPEPESALQKLVSANLGTLQELTLPDSESFQIHQLVTSRLVKLELDSYIERLKDLQCLGDCRLLKELTLSFDQQAVGKSLDEMPELHFALHKVSLTGAADTVFLLQKLCLVAELRSLQLDSCLDPDGKLRQFLTSCERLENLGFWSILPAVLCAPPQLQELALCAGEVSSSPEFTQALAKGLEGRPLRRLYIHSVDSLTFVDCWNLVLRTPTLENAVFSHFYDDSANCSARALSPERLVADSVEHPCLKLLELTSALHLPEQYQFPLGSVVDSVFSLQDTYSAAGMLYWAKLVDLPHVRFHHTAPLNLNDDGSVARNYVRLDLGGNGHRSVTLIVRAD